MRSGKQDDPVDFDSPASVMSDDVNYSYNRCFVLKLHGPRAVESLHKALADIYLQGTNSSKMSTLHS